MKVRELIAELNEAADMLTREQWSDLARFAGVAGECWDGRWYFPLKPEFDNGPACWHPDKCWSDFGPLWVKLEVWLGDGTSPDQPLHSATWDFECAKMEGDEKMLMETGCLLGAAIGATMKQEPDTSGKQ